MKNLTVKLLVGILSIVLCQHAAMSKPGETKTEHKKKPAGKENKGEKALKASGKESKIAHHQVEEGIHTLDDEVSDVPSRMPSAMPSMMPIKKIKEENEESNRKDDNKKNGDDDEELLSALEAGDESDMPSKSPTEEKKEKFFIKGAEEDEMEDAAKSPTPAPTPGQNRNEELCTMFLAQTNNSSVDCEMYKRLKRVCTLNVNGTAIYALEEGTRQERCQGIVDKLPEEATVDAMDCGFECLRVTASCCIEGNLPE